jgi:hypothetical protein
MFYGTNSTYLYQKLKQLSNSTDKKKQAALLLQHCPEKMVLYTAHNLHLPRVAINHLMAIAVRTREFRR